MIYYNIEKKEQGIFFIENRFNRKFLLKTETVFSQCNGYMGIRAAFDSKVLEENRGMFVGGIYNKAYDNEVAELVNCPDITEIQLIFQNEKFSIDTSRLLEYRRALNVLTGELTIHMICRLNNGLEVKIDSRRFASFKDSHLFCQNIKVTPLNGDANITFVSGINGQVTNSGVSHFGQIDCRVYDKAFMHMKASLEKDSVSIISACMADPIYKEAPEFVLKRRSIYAKYQFEAVKDRKITFTKYNYIKNYKAKRSIHEEELKKILKVYMDKGYDILFTEHKKSMDEMWKYAKIEIKGASLEEEAAICFAQYHMLGMAPCETSEISVGAKGLTGVGYKGHVFWDTELFVLPFFQYTFPDIARNLLEFRYHGLEGARAKAVEYGYKGAMFPWEVAKDGYEQTPLYAALNIHTGKADKVWSGIKEHHITADIVYAIWEYYTFTADEAFMVDYGYPIIFEAAIFWCSRAVYQADKKQYHILDIIGPDEYTEHVDNNAYSNYMAYFCVDIAKKAASELKNKKPDIYENMNKNFLLEVQIKKWEEFLDKLYLPKPNKDNIIPQDDTFLSKKTLKNIEYYKQHQKKQAILLDYSRAEVGGLQVLKQADVVMLLNLFPHMFPRQLVKSNVVFYESRTIHDSSLSYCAHSQALASIGETDMAFDFFLKSMETDINDNPNDSTDGVHSASLGGIWNCVIFGFAGLSHEKEYIKLSPNLPKSWKEIKFFISVKGTYVKINISRDIIMLKCERELDSAVKVRVYEQEYDLKDILKVPVSGESI